jgi:hypothetical protein
VRLRAGAGAAAALVAASLLIWSRPWAFALLALLVITRPLLAVWRFARATPEPVSGPVPLAPLRWMRACA